MSTFRGSLNMRGGAMTLRRTFKKSRRGCRTCKTRKVKCDEVRPICGNCSRRFVGLKECTFELFIDSSPASFEGKSNGDCVRPLPPFPNHFAIRPAMSSYPIEMGTSADSRVLELRLMHHYASFTCGELPDGHTSQGKKVWSIDIPRLAFHSDLVLSALLGISALHLYALVPDDKSIAYAGKLYLDRAVRKHRMALSNVDSYTAESLLAAAILITHHTWLAAHTKTGNEPYELPLQTYYMARGIQSLIDHMWPLLKGSGYLWYVEQHPIEDVDETGSGSHFLASVQEDLAVLSETFKEDDVSASDKEVYEKTVLELSSICKFITTGAAAHWMQRRVATMPLWLPKRFLELAEQKDPRALVLLARNLALLKLIDSIWWLHGFGQSQQVAEYSIAGIQGLVPTEWMWAMTWPVQVVAGDIKLDGQRKG